MKKILAMILAVAMVLGLAACGSGTSSAPAKSETAPAKSEAAPAADSTATSSWPSDTVSMYVPAKAGGGTDMAARLFIQGMNEVNGGNYIVVNDVTGGGTVAFETVRNAKPDGLTLMMYHGGICTTIASGQYSHTLDEFAICGLFITMSNEASGGIFVPGNSPFNTIEELVEYAKEHPGELIAGAQTGSSSALLEALFENAVGIESTVVDAGSNADKVTALMGNQVDYVIMNTTGNDQYVQSGDLKCLVVWGVENSERSSIIPDAPTIEEVYPDIDMPRISSYGFIAGPKSMSQEDINEINRVIKGAIETDTVQEGYKKLSCVVEYVPIDEATELMRQCQEANDQAYALLEQN